MNRFKLLGLAIPLMLFAGAAQAQGTITNQQPQTIGDSASTVKTLPAVLVMQQVNKDSLKLVAGIDKDSIKLVKLQAKLADVTKNKDDATMKAQELANENNQAAAQLSQDPLHKKNARNAERLSSNARTAAKKARIATKSFNAVSKDIRSLQRSMAKKQKKLNKIRAAALKPAKG